MTHRKITAFNLATDGVEVFVHLTPKSSKNEIKGFKRYSDEFVYANISVTAPPEDNKANKALIKLIKKTWKPKKVELITGDTSRFKKLLLIGNSDQVLSSITAWMDKNDMHMPLD